MEALFEAAAVSAVVESAAETALLRVEDQLDAAIACLLQMRFPTTAGACAPHEQHLTEASALLKQLGLDARAGRAQGLSKARMSVFASSVQARTRQIQLLLDSATGLCRGWLLAAPPAPLDYAPAGVWANVYEPSQMRYEA